MVLYTPVVLRPCSASITALASVTDVVFNWISTAYQLYYRKTNEFAKLLNEIKSVTVHSVQQDLRLYIREVSPFPVGV